MININSFFFRLVIFKKKSHSFDYQGNENKSLGLKILADEAMGSMKNLKSITLFLPM